MNKEKAKQYLRNQIDSCIKRQNNYNKDHFYLCYNKNYIRALKFSKITGQTVNKENFNGGDIIFGVDTETKDIWYYLKIYTYLEENYSIYSAEQKKLIVEVFNEYSEYKNYKCWG